MLDHLFTWRLLSRGAGEELNPLMKEIMNLPFWASFSIKNGWTVGMLVVIYFLEKKNRRMRIGINLVLIIYGLVIAYHLYGLTV